MWDYKNMRDDIVISEIGNTYPDFPYLPNIHYPEFNNDANYKYDNYVVNNVYDAIRNIFKRLRLDDKNVDTDNWDPFSEFISKGKTVLIKPNWVMDYNPKGNIECLVTHTSLIKVILDYLLKALKYNGRIIIGDAPLQSCDFNNLVQKTKVDELIQYYIKTYPGVEFLIKDWRKTIIRRGIIPNTRQVKTDKNDDDYVLVDLGKESLLTDIEEYCDDFRVTCYNNELIQQHHNLHRHEYLVTRAIFDADLIVNLPKLKTHKKAGLTGALKNMVGINGHKEYLPHYIKRSYIEGGDKYIMPGLIRRVLEDFDEKIWMKADENKSVYSSFCLLVYRILNNVYRIISKDKTDTGSWSGNETIWRTILDLNHILYFYSTKTQKLENKQQRHLLTIVDGIIAGQGNGPLKSVEKKLGMLLGGFNPANIDAAIARIIGYNISRIPTIYNALYNVKSLFSLKRDEKVMVNLLNDNDKVELNEINQQNFILPVYWLRAKAKR